MSNYANSNGSLDGRNGGKGDFYPTTPGSVSVSITPGIGGYSLTAPAPGSSSSGSGTHSTQTMAILINHGDDYGKGKSDLSTGGSLTAIPSDDKDLAEIKLSYTDTVPNGCILRLTTPQNVKIWKDRKKTEMLCGSSDSRDWTVGSGSIPSKVYAEGCSASAEIKDQTIKWECGTGTGNEATQIICVLQPYWKGFIVPERWHHSSEIKKVETIDGKRYGDVGSGYIRTQYPDITIPNDTSVPEKIRGKRGGGDSDSSNAKSVLNYESGFTLELEYEYDHTPVIIPEVPGYVPINNNGSFPHKLSFIANSGVKFGNAVDAKGKDRPTEAAIIDVEKLVAMARGKKKNPAGGPDIVVVGIDAFKWDEVTKTGIDKDGFVIGLSNSYITGTATFASEHVTQLMSHVIYGGDPETIDDFKEAVETVRTEYYGANSTKPFVKFTDTEKQKVWWNTLNNNHDNHGTHMKIQVIKEDPLAGSSPFTVVISRRKNGNDLWEVSCEYSTSNYPTLPYPDASNETEKMANEIQRRLCFTILAKVELQTHWHSGVKFINAIGLEA